MFSAKEWEKVLTTALNGTRDEVAGIVEQWFNPHYVQITDGRKSNYE